MNEIILGGKIETWYWTQGPLAEELKKEIPEIKAATPFSWPRHEHIYGG